MNLSWPARCWNDPGRRVWEAEYASDDRIAQSPCFPPGSFHPSRRTSLLICCDGAGKVTDGAIGTVTGRRPISSAVRTAVLRQKAKELARDNSSVAIASAAYIGFMHSTASALARRSPIHAPKPLRCASW